MAKKRWLKFFKSSEETIKSFNASRFKDTEKLVNLKNDSGKKFILCLPVMKGERDEPLLNELRAATGLKREGFLDQIILAYSGTEKDSIPQAIRSSEISEDVEVIFTDRIRVPDMLPSQVERGKGADMRRVAYYITTQLLHKGEDLKSYVVGFLDGDILPVAEIQGKKVKAFGPHFILSLFGPFIIDPVLKMVSLAYCRPLGYSRVNKLIAQPLFSLLKHKKLDPIRPPYVISGEKAWDLLTLLDLRFRQKYGEETQKWLDAAFKISPSAIGTVNVGFFDHKHQAIEDLRAMSFGILRTWLENLLEQGLLKLGDEVEISDVLEYSEINPKGQRVYFRKEFEEKTYPPLAGLFHKEKELFKPSELTQSS